MFSTMFSLESSRFKLDNQAKRVLNSLESDNRLFPALSFNYSEGDVEKDFRLFSSTGHALH
jgi:hypothetical protein